MTPELKQLIRLQQLENTATEARGQLEDIPARLEALERALAEHAEVVEAANLALNEQRTSRATLEKNVAEVEGRLNRFKEQLMSVKTNKEYQAMQTEIAVGKKEVGRLEDQLLERMLEADALSQDVIQAQQRLAEEQTRVDTGREHIEQERAALQAQLETFDLERNKVAEQLPSQAMSLFESLARERKGIAVVEAKLGRCTSCQVRLRPQLFNDVRLNSALIQCESCQRILYFAEHQAVAG
jgi:predicted  nucleic acid-binding Zn-ribbon protein